jgi:hypothetical protein
MQCVRNLVVAVTLCGVLLIVSTADARWSSTKVVSEESDVRSLKPSLDVDPDGAVHMAWYDDAGTSEEWDVFYRRGTRADCWRGWFFKWSPVEVLSAESNRQCEFPCLCSSPDGVVHVVWGDGSTRISYRRHDPGTGWSATETVLPYTPNFAPSSIAMGAGSDGEPHVLWLQWPQGSPPGIVGDIFYSSREPGTGWTSPVAVTSDVTAGAYSSCLDVAEDGSVHIAWEGSAGGDWDLFYRRRNPAGQWSAAEIVSAETDGDPTDPALKIGPDGIVHVVWAEWSEYGNSGRDWDIFYRRHEQSAGWSKTEVVSTAGSGWSAIPSLDVDADGIVHIAWYDDSDHAGSEDDPDIFYRQYGLESGWSEIQVISGESTGNSRNPSLGVASDGTVHIAWEDGTDLCDSGSDRDIFYRGSESPPYCIGAVGIALAMAIFIAAILYARRRARSNG